MKDCKYCKAGKRSQERHWCGTPTATTRASRAIVLEIIYHKRINKLYPVPEFDFVGYCCEYPFTQTMIQVDTARPNITLDPTPGNDRGALRRGFGHGAGPRGR